MAEIPQEALDYINARCPRNELAPGESQIVDSTDTNECFMYLLDTIFGLLPLVTLDTPESLEAVPGDNQITLIWAVVPKATGYIVTRDGITIYSGIFPTYTDDDVFNGQEHTYQVFAFASGYVTSAPATIVTEAAEPDIPTLTAPGLVVTPGDGQLSVAVTPDDDATSTTVEISSDNFATIAGTESSGTSPIVLSATNGTAYKVRAYSTAAGFNQSATTVASGTYTPEEAGETLLRYFGELVSGDTPDVPTIEALESTAASGAMTIQFTNGTDEWLCFAYPDTETDPTTYYIGPLDNGTLGPGGTFAAPVTVAPYRVIISNYPTQIPDPVQFS